MASDIAPVGKGVLDLIETYYFKSLSNKRISVYQDDLVRLSATVGNFKKFQFLMRTVKTANAGLLFASLSVEIATTGHNISVTQTFTAGHIYDVATPIVIGASIATGVLAPIGIPLAVAYGFGFFNAGSRRMHSITITTWNDE